MFGLSPRDVARLTELGPVAILAHEEVTRRIRIVASHDPLATVPRGSFTLDDYSYDESELCHHDFANCRLRNLGKKA